MAAGWNVRVTTFDADGKPAAVRNFLAYEADKGRAVELVRKRLPVREGEQAEAVTEVAANELVAQRMRPCDEDGTAKLRERALTDRHKSLHGRNNSNQRSI